MKKAKRIEKPQVEARKMLQLAQRALARKDYPATSLAVAVALRCLTEADPLTKKERAVVRAAVRLRAAWQSYRDGRLIEPPLHEERALDNAVARLKKGKS